MRLKIHPGVRRDVREILIYYDERSDTVGERFIEEVNKQIARIKSDPNHFHFSDAVRRRCNLERFPYHIIFDVVGGAVRILVLRHHSRHPDFGLRRRWR
jgi:plasmid stabilization system protein ParE